MTPQDISALEKLFTEIVRDIVERELRVQIPDLVQRYLVERDAMAYLNNQRKLQVAQLKTSITE